VVLSNVKGLQITTTWCSSIIEKSLNEVTGPFLISNCTNYSDATMSCAAFISFNAIKEDSSAKYAEINGNF
jgi:hypothetical protein